MAFVYWIHLPEHTDMFSEGYIGFTSKTVSFRFRQHKDYLKSGKKNYLYNAIRKFGVENVVVDTIVEGSPEYCLELEYKLRPSPKIGWNAGIGGENTMAGYKHSEETKAKMSASSPTKGKKLDLDYVAVRAESRKAKCLKHSEAARNKMSITRKLICKDAPWGNPAANTEVWIDAQRVFEHYSEFKLGQYNTEKALNFKKDKLKTVHLKLKSGWIPSLDESYTEWLKIQQIKG